MSDSRLLAARERCPVCAEGWLHPQTETRRHHHVGHEGAVLMRYSVCDACGSEVANAEQTRANKAAIQDFRSRAEQSTGKA